jgi:hypothetical protein
MISFAQVVEDAILGINTGDKRDPGIYFSPILEIFGALKR